jgi:hypothetical protein
MSNPTSNYSFQMPTSTDLVTDLPADFEVFGQAVDTQLKALNPSTTLGDIEYRSSTANTNTRLGIGSSGQVLTVSGGIPTWATAAAGGMTLISTINASAASSVSFTSIPTSYKHLLLVWDEVFQNSGLNYYWNVRFNNDTGTDYRFRGIYYNDAASPPNTNFINADSATAFGGNYKYSPIMPTNSVDDEQMNSYGNMWIYDYSDTTIPKQCNLISSSMSSGDAVYQYVNVHGVYRDSAELAVTQIDFIRSHTQTLTGTFKLYGVS